MQNEQNQPKTKVKFLYAMLYLLLDIENLWWKIAEIIIKPTATLRRWVAYQISKLVELK